MFSIKGVCIGANTIITSQFDLTSLVEVFFSFLGEGGGRRELQLRTRIGTYHFFPANSKRIGTFCQSFKTTIFTRIGKFHDLHRHHIGIGGAVEAR
jgi:hypothetical protein